MTNDPPNEPDLPDNVIALSKYRARLGRGRRMRSAEALMALPDPERAIRALPGDELYYLLREDDPREAKELLAYATPEQIQVVLDFGLWSGNEMLPERMEEWIEVMAELPFETVGAWVRGLDIELVTLLIRKGARIYDLEIEDPPDDPVGMFYPTPDRFFVLDVMGYQPRGDTSEDAPPDDAEGGESESSSAHALIRVIDALYRADLDLARRILVGAKAELDSGLEEMALRWRQGRMADLGFIDAVEALEVYRELDPATVRIGELRPGTRVRPVGVDDAHDPPDLLRAPGALGEQLTGPSLFGRALSRVTSAAESEELHFALVGLTNRVLAADRVDAADDAKVLATLARLRATLDLAVEFLARQPGTGLDEDRAVDAVRTISLMRLFRLGTSLVGKVRNLARALTLRGPFSALAHLDLVEEPEASVLAAASRARPLYAGVLDDPPKVGDRPFASLADVARATAAIQRAAVAQAMLLGLGVRPEHLLPKVLEGTAPADVVAIDTGLLARTALALFLSRTAKTKTNTTLKGKLGTDETSTGAAIDFRALTPAEVARFREPQAVPRKRVEAAARTGKSTATRSEPFSAIELGRAKRLLAQVAPRRMEEAAATMADRWVATLSPLESVLVRDKQPRPRR